jgi:plasmid stabilization system protein ParE
MKLRWTDPARADLIRLHDFLETVNPRAADRVAKALDQAARRPLEFPRVGARLEKYQPREVRRLIVGDYELRYEIVEDTIFIVRFWHCREDR